MKKERLEKAKRIERIILLPILAIAGAAFFTLGRVEVQGVSMMPTFQDGQRLIILKAWKQFSSLKVGDVVVVNPNGKKGRETQVIKRIVFIQNSAGSLPWPGVVHTTKGDMLSPMLFSPDMISAGIPPNGMLVLGDNLDNSTDSREYGPVFPNEVYGKVLANK
ncbi:MAG: S26 family signal peptidase [Armatimonas sp.]